MKSLFSFSTAQTEKNWWKKLGKTRLVVGWFDVTNKIQITVLHPFLISSFQFCCLARQRIKPFVTAKDFSEIVAAAKRLNIDLNGKGKSFVPMVANADPKHVEKAVEKIKEVEKELVNVEETKEKTKIQGVQLKSVFIRLS